MSYPQQDPYGQQAAPGALPADYPGKTLGIVGLVVAIVAGGLIGMIISIIAAKQSKEAGFPNTPAKAGIIVGAILTALGVIAVIIYIIVIAAVLANAGSYN